MTEQATIEINKGNVVTVYELTIKYDDKNTLEKLN